MTATAPEGEAPDTDLDKQARTLLERARAALASGNNEVAINALNQLLLLPPNKFSQEAQELIGVARERAGETEQARKEYELYLKLFPTGEGATRVRQRLASLAPPPSQESSAATTAATTPVVSPKWGVNGSLSQYYYGGKTQVNTTFLNTPTTANQQSLTSTSQSSLVSTLDLSGRYRDENNDARLILRDTSDKSFIGGATPGTNRLDSAYIDYRNTSYGFSAKVGRQSGVTGGLIGRFDGAILGYDLSPKWRVNVTGGIPTDTLVNSRQNFEGVNVEAQNLWDHWSGDAFFMNQMADGVTDRRAIGGDLRYFDSVRTVYAMMDYDVIFRTLNAATLQGTWQLPDQTSLSVLVDVRKAPELLTSNALIPFGATSLTQLLQGDPALGIPALSLDQIREEAKAITANSKQASFSVSRPFWTKWQASFDVRLTNVGPLPFIVVPSAVAGVSNTLPAQPGTRNVYTYDFQVSGTKLTRISPALRATYKVLKHLSIESQLLYERSKTTGPTQQDKTNNTFYYIGYRYDLQ